MPFHRRGATALNARSSKVLHLVLGSRKLTEFDCSDRADLCNCSRSEIYPGASPCIALKQRRMILYSILCWIGSQCSVLSTCVMWSYFLTPQTRCAAAF